MKLNGFDVSGQDAVGVRSATGPYTPERANAALPLVRRIVQDIVGAYHAVHDLHRRLHALPECASSDETRRLLCARSQALERLAFLQEELVSMGCELKDPQHGLVDFPARRSARSVCLCWKLGEERVAYWHERNAGFASRKPIDKLRGPRTEL